MIAHLEKKTDISNYEKYDNSILGGVIEEYLFEMVRMKGKVF
jgi:hypothetical protein